MNTQQKIADILMLVTYIKEHLDVQSREKQNEQLDKIGSAVLSMSTKLHDLTETMKDDTEKTGNSYQTFIDTITDTMIAKLESIAKIIGEQDNTTRDTLEKIEEVYNTYVDILAETTTTFNAQNKTYSNDIQKMNEGIETLNNTVGNIDKKILSENQLMNFVDGIQEQLSTLITKDKELMETFEKNRNDLSDMMSTMTKDFGTVKENVISVEDIFSTSIARLNVIDLKINALTKALGGMSDGTK